MTTFPCRRNRRNVSQGSSSYGVVYLSAVRGSEKWCGNGGRSGSTSDECTVVKVGRAGEGSAAVPGQDMGTLPEEARGATPPSHELHLARYLLIVMCYVYHMFYHSKCLPQPILVPFRADEGENTASVTVCKALGASKQKPYSV